MSYNSDEIKKTKYTKGYIANIISDNTMCKYFYKKKMVKNIYLYSEKMVTIYANIMSGYYVFEKVN